MDSYESTKIILGSLLIWVKHALFIALLVSPDASFSSNAVMSSNSVLEEAVAEQTSTKEIILRNKKAISCLCTLTAIRWQQM